MTITRDSPFCDKSLKEIKVFLKINYIVAFVLRENEHIIPSGDTVLRDEDKLYIIATEEDLEKIFAIAGKVQIKLNKIVIVGGGKIGSYTADHLLRRQKGSQRLTERIASTFVHHLKRNIVIIDKDMETCNMLAEQFPDALILNEDISDEGIYEEGQLTDYDLIITATNDQELNLISAVYAKTIGFKRSIAVVNKNSYINIASKLGIDVTVSQTNSMVNSILKLIRKGNIKNVYNFADGMVEVIELLVENTHASGVRIRDLKLPPHALVVSITRGEENILPDGNSIIQNGDDIIVIANREDILKILAIFIGK
jgi:trk system potassium uptake protein TrkA